MRFPKVEKSLQVICGTPKTVLPKIRKVLEVLRPGVFGFWQNDGPISAKDRTNSMRLIATEVLPAVREMGKELDLVLAVRAHAGSAQAAGHRRSRIGGFAGSARVVRVFSCFLTQRLRSIGSVGAVRFQESAEAIASATARGRLRLCHLAWR